MASIENANRTSGRGNPESGSLTSGDWVRIVFLCTFALIAGYAVLTP